MKTKGVPAMPWQFTTLRGSGSGWKYTFRGRPMSALGHKRTFRSAIVMSALGQKRTYAVQNGMSALPPKADMCGATGDVRFGPIADILRLFDHLVGAADQ
jgi:hypothetical protein